MIVLDANLTAADYDRAMNDSRLTLLALAALYLVLGLAIMVPISSTLPRIVVGFAGVLASAEKWRRLQESGILYFVLAMLAIALPMTGMFVWVMGRSFFGLLRQAWRPRTYRDLREGIHLGPMKYIIAEDGLVLRMQDARRFFPWSAFASAQRAPNRIRLLFSPEGARSDGAGMFIPSRLLANEEQLGEFVFCLNCLIRDARK